MNKREINVKEESQGVVFVKAMLESQRQTEKYILDMYNDMNSDFRKKIEERRKENLDKVSNHTQHVPI